MTIVCVKKEGKNTASAQEVELYFYHLAVKCKINICLDTGEISSLETKSLSRTYLLVVGLFTPSNWLWLEPYLRLTACLWKRAAGARDDALWSGVAAVSRCVSVCRAGLFAVATELWVERRNIFLLRSDVQNKQRDEGWSYSPLGPKFHSYHAARESYCSLSPSYWDLNNFSRGGGWNYSAANINRYAPCSAALARG